MSRDRRGEQAEEREMEVEGSEEGEGEVEETGQGRKTKTGRNVRFSHDENCVLVHNIIPCYEVILGNLAARTPLRRRHQLWGRVCEAVNAVGPLKRTVAHCRKRFSDIKRRLKEKMAQERRSTRRTGGGPPLRMEYTTYEEELRQIMPAEIVEGINVQDTDSPSFGQVVDSPGPQFSPSARPTPPPSARDSGTDEQAGPSSYQPPQAESLEMSPEPEDQTTITLVTVDAPVSGLQEVSPGPAEPSHHQPAPESMDPAREMALSIGAFQQQQTLFMDRQTRHMSQIAAQLRRIHRSNSQLPAGINRLATALEQINFLSLVPDFSCLPVILLTPDRLTTPFGSSCCTSPPERYRPDAQSRPGLALRSAESSVADGFRQGPPQGGCDIAASAPQVAALRDRQDQMGELGSLEREGQGESS
ncbi:uncharacterized protein LOC142150812 [Mixophyes fleayi]|uniref:uncharacterized protein LOC142150812 n=1 Tax=Mixophyes fleayi TaxID=3061075 RepID=UPI003F4D8C80